MLPRRRDKGLLTETMNEETVVYDTTRHQVHCLDAAATLVWQHCDGQTTASEMAELLRDATGLPADEASVGLILGQLVESHLLSEEPPSRPKGEVRRSRRSAAKQLALAGLSGVVLTIAAPTAAMAASGLPDGAGCSASAQCQSGCCCQGGTDNNTCRSTGCAQGKSCK